MLTQLKPPIPLRTPKGKALAYFTIDYGIEHDLCWICFLESTGECWTFQNPEIRWDLNVTEGREYISPFYDPDSVKLNKTEDHSYFDAISRRYDKKCDCEHQQASKPVSQQAGETASQYAVEDRLKDHRGRLYQWDGKGIPNIHNFKEDTDKDFSDYAWAAKGEPNPIIPWNLWSDYLPDEGKFYFTARKAGGPFFGQRHTNHLNIIEIKLDARYRLEDHGMIVGWKPYE